MLTKSVNRPSSCAV